MKYAKSFSAVGKNVTGILGAGIAGSFLYDYLSRKNMEKLGSVFSWDDDWDRFVRVSPEMQHDVKDWFVAPDNDIVKNREIFEENNHIGIRDIVLVRHGQYEDGGALTVVGKEQAVLTGKRLSEILKHKNVRCIYVSNLLRAKETAKEIAKMFPKADLVETSLLNEAVPAPPDPPSSVCPEFVPEEGERIEKAFRSFFARPVGDSPNNESVDILVGHGNCFRYFLCRALQIDPRAWLRMAVYNCGISWVELDHQGGVSVRSVGDTGHIPPDKLTYS